jgi:aspartyl-tRNA synthetase
MGKFRNYLAELTNIINNGEISFCWIIDFPIFEEDEAT